MDSRCTSCTEPIDRRTKHVVVVRHEEHHDPVEGATIVDEAEVLAEFHDGECAPSAADLGELVNR